MNVEHIVGDASSRLGATPPAVVQAGRCYGEALLLSTFDTLLLASPEVINAMTLSVPAEGNDEATALQELALELAEEFDMHADIEVNHGHLIVRLTRQQTNGI